MFDSPSAYLAGVLDSAKSVPAHSTASSFQTVWYLSSGDVASHIIFVLWLYLF